MWEDACYFRFFQCGICGKMLDSEDAQREHERKCRRDVELLYRSETFEEQLIREGMLTSH
jgi:hypothetical protein